MSTQRKPQGGSTPLTDPENIEIVWDDEETAAALDPERPEQPQRGEGRPVGGR